MTVVDDLKWWGLELMKILTIEKFFFVMVNFITKAGPYVHRFCSSRDRISENS